MAQNITLMGANYSAVPAVTLPKTGGGTASFTDVSDTTATASDVATGTYFYTAAGVKTEGTASGGGGTAVTTVSFDENCFFTGNLIFYVDGNGAIQQTSILATFSPVSYQMLSKSILIWMDNMDPEMSGAIYGAPSGMSVKNTGTIDITPQYKAYYQIWQVD